jgi:hypothetical protein
VSRRIGRGLLLWGTVFWAGVAIGQPYEDQLAKSRAAAAAKQYEEAETAAEMAITLDDKRWEAYVLAANAYSSQRLYDDAIGMLQMALVRVPEDKKQLVRDAISDARGRASAPAVPSTAVVARPAPPSTAPTQSEIVLWKSIENSDRFEDFHAYLEQYPNGTFAVLATSRAAELEAVFDAELTEALAREAEAEELAEIRRYTFPVVHVHPSLTFINDPGCYGYLQITPEGLSYEGGETLRTSKAGVEHIDVASTALGYIMRFHLTDGGQLRFGLSDEPDVQNRHATGFYPPARIGNVVVEKWGWNLVRNNKRIVPPD